MSVHKLASSKHLAPDEVQGFADALASINVNLQVGISLFIFQCVSFCVFIPAKSADMSRLKLDYSVKSLVSS
jgi:hypothetical protein